MLRGPLRPIRGCPLRDPKLLQLAVAVPRSVPGGTVVEDLELCIALPSFAHDRAHQTATQLLRGGGDDRAELDLEWIRGHGLLAEPTAAEPRRGGSAGLPLPSE